MELLNSLDSVAAELTIPTHFLLMVRTTTRKAGKPSLHIFKNLFNSYFQQVLSLTYLTEKFSLSLIDYSG